MQLHDPLMTGICLLGPQGEGATRGEDVILLRAGSYLYAHWFNVATGRVEVSSCKCNDLKTLANVSNDLRRDMEAISAKEPKLVLDMKEEERDPNIMLRMVSAMGTDADRDTFKTSKKGGGTEFLLTQPWSFEECDLAAMALEFSGFEGMIKACRENFSVAGGRPRLLFQWTPEDVSLYRSELSFFNLLWRDLAVMNWDNMPKGASVFIAPVLKPGVTSPRVHLLEDNTVPFKFAFLGPLQTASVLSGTNTAAKLRQLADRYCMLDHDVHQMLVLLGLMRVRDKTIPAMYPALPEVQQIQNWHWYKGSSAKSRRTKLGDAACEVFLCFVVSASWTMWRRA